MRGHHEHDEWATLPKELRNTCQHKPPRRTTGIPMGQLDTCKCGATTYVLRHRGNDGSNRPGKRWDYWKGVRP